MGSRIYSDYFGIPENAFSITPDPRFLFMSEQHCEALAHLRYGLVESGCFILLTGEVGTGKTTVCRALLEQLPENLDVALLLSPPKTWQELLLSIADELHVPITNRDAAQHELVRAITQHLLENYGQGRRTVVIIDEAQNISSDVLEQVRLLTNLETNTDKLLHVILVGQPELRDLLLQPSLRQLAQRITARYHLGSLSAAETGEYVGHRLSVGGCRQWLFTKGALRTVYLESGGIPRVINILCDRALLGAFANDEVHVTSKQIHQAARQWRGEPPRNHFWSRIGLAALLVSVVLTTAAVVISGSTNDWQKSITMAAARTAAVASSSSSNKQDLYQASGPAGARPANVAQTSRTTESKAADTVASKAEPLPYGVRTIGPNSPPQAVRWLRRELDRVEQTSSSENGPLFDDQLRKRVMAIQHKLGLVADGIAGPQTLSYMHVIYGTSVPFQNDPSWFALRSGT